MTPLLSTGDRLDIADLYARYNLFIDTDCEDDWVALWTPDAVFTASSVSRGHDELHGFVRRRRAGLASRTFDDAQHWNNSLVLTPRDGWVEGVCYLARVARAIDSGSVVLPTLATYYDRIVRTEHGWRFAARTMISSMTELAARRAANPRRTP